MKIQWVSTLAMLASVLAASHAIAAITYVDAQIDPASGTPNTTLTNGDPVPFTLDGGSGGTGSDGLWRLRTFASNGPSVLESNGDFNGGANSEDDPRLRTRISGLAPGDYSIYAYFVGNHPDMRLAASLTDEAGHLPVYTVGNGGFPGDGVGDQVTDAELISDFSNTVTNDTAFGNDTLYQVLLGTASSVGGIIDVFIDDDTTSAVLDGRAPTPGGNDGGSLRTAYEGVGYESLVPEPAALGMVLVAGLAGLPCRRRG